MIKALKGQTTIDEILRITHQESIVRDRDLISDRPGPRCASGPGSGRPDPNPGRSRCPEWARSD